MLHVRDIHQWVPGLSEGARLVHENECWRVHVKMSLHFPPPDQVLGLCPAVMIQADLPHQNQNQIPKESANQSKNLTEKLTLQGHMKWVGCWTENRHG